MNVSHWSDLPLVLTSKQAAAVLQLKPRTVANLLDRGDLRGVKIGKEWRVSRAELMRFVFGQESSGTQQEIAVTVDRTPAIMDKEGILVVQAEPLEDLTEFTRHELDRRLAALLGQVGM